MKARLILLGATLSPLPAAALQADERLIDFNRDIRPVLAAKCFPCHGRDESHREADLRLDDREVAIEFEAIVPGKPDESELIRRINSEDPDQRMPPPTADDALTDPQRELLRQWIQAGAEYKQHWAFTPPTRPKLPPTQDTNWPRNEIDRFVLARLEASGLSPSPAADRYALVRRLYLDLIGLPPTPEEADAFVQDDSPQAYGKLVDRLLDSKHYGERWARQWLDLARYADTNGYEKDRPRTIWPYRDWVIRALDADMPFDQFTIEQLAGDMLPDASENQLVATGLHRNTMLNEEGGIDPLEYRFYAMVDRVATTGTIWLGLTIGCAQCHTHKYDPITHTDYYRFMALMNNADEPDLVLKGTDASARRQQLVKQIDRLQSELPAKFPPLDGDEPMPQRRRMNLETHFQAWLTEARRGARRWTVLRPFKMQTNLPRLEVLDDGSIFSTGDITKRDVFELKFQLNEAALPLTAIRLEVLPDERLPAGGPGRAFYEGRKGDFFLSELTASIDRKPVPLVSATHSYGKISIGNGTATAANVLDNRGSTGWSTAQREGQSHQLVLNLAQPIKEPGTLQITLLFERHFAASLGRFRFAVTGHQEQAAASQLPVELEALLASETKEFTPQDRQRLLDYYTGIAPELAKARKPLDRLRNQLPTLPTTMILRERPADNPRPTHRHHRGEYLNPAEQVTPGVPEFLIPPGKVASANRLELARWLVSPANPLVGRVTANRAWQAFFGRGLHVTSGDFGTQAEAPLHRDLLDWLACEFIEQGWSLKSLHRLIVTSATYRQSSTFTPQLLKRDPSNELLARGPRFRVNAEMVRDIMLQASGLLSAKKFGPSVYPPQPASVTALAYGSTRWDVSTGEDRYRRSLYTFSKRTAPFASYTVFDGPTGESCIARRDRSNTPLQALTLLNDEMYLEMSRALAKLAVSRSSKDEEIARIILRRLVTRLPEDAELAAVLDYQQSQLTRLTKGDLEAARIAADEEASDEMAAWIMTARALMNLDEVITKP